MRRAFKYRFYPTDEQADLLNRTFGCVRKVWNLALAERSRVWTQEQRRVTYVDTARMLTAWKRDPELWFLSEVSNVPLQQGLRQLQTAYVNFWQKRARYPRFKSKRKSRASATFMSNAFSLRDGRLTLAKMREPLDIVWSRPLPEGAEPSQVTVSRNARGQYYVSILVETTVKQHGPSGRTVGVDAGITSLATLSTGEKITNPQHEKRDRKRLARVQRVLSRKRNGSANRAKAKLRVAKVHGKVADRRRDNLHKITTDLVRRFDVVAIEDLTVRNMVRNHKLARSINDAAWSEFRRQLEYKADWYGRTVVAIDRFYPSSKTCSACGAIIDKLPLNVREWTCACGVTHDRDVNAAINIRGAGLALLACGDGVRPPRT